VQKKRASQSLELFGEGCYESDAPSSSSSSSSSSPLCFFAPLPDPSSPTNRLERLESYLSQSLSFSASESASASAIFASRKKDKGNSYSYAKGESFGNGTRIGSRICTICLVSFHDGEDICSSRNVDCVHTFHKDCIIEWLIMDHDECPICRQNFLLCSATIEKEEETKEESGNNGQVPCNDIESGMANSTS